MNRLTFKRQQRLLNATDYTGVFDHVEIKISHPLYLMLVRRVADSVPARMGLIAAKKHLRHAVQRNTFKRIARESFRHHQHDLAPVELIIMARSGAAQATPAELRIALDQAWTRLAKRLAQLQTESPTPPSRGTPTC